MKTIFSETSKPITNIQTKVYDNEDDRVYTNVVSATVVTTAHYDHKLCVLVVDQSVEINPALYARRLLWTLPPRRTLESHPTAAAATRRAIELADEYEDRLSKTVFDDERSADELRAEYKARWEGELAF